MKLNKNFSELLIDKKQIEILELSLDYIRINIASPEQIKYWAQKILPNQQIVGEILTQESINFRTNEPEINGLFCEQIFGPLKNWKCRCGKYKGFLINKICEECKVELIESRVRNYRMGYINLNSPITHLWYLTARPSYLVKFLKQKKSLIEDIIYFRQNTFDFIEKNELNIFSKLESKSILKKKTGSELIKSILENIDLATEIKNARSLLSSTNVQLNYNMELKELFSTLRLFESFFATKTELSWMIFVHLPVLPPNLRPFLDLSNGEMFKGDINELYQLVLMRNEKILYLNLLNIPTFLLMQSQKLLQEAVDSLIDNTRLSETKKLTLNNRVLKGLAEGLEGKDGQFRQLILGKRVDYSARSVIIVNPILNLNQCGLPYSIVVELFQPFLMHELLKYQNQEFNTKLVQNIIKHNKPFLWTLLNILIKKYSIILNRAPTLHRLGLQSFDPIIVMNNAIHIHPLICAGFNADFDGDQMAVYLPLYVKSQLEIKSLMRPCYNVFSSSNGNVILKPTQDMVIGCYYLTLMIGKYKEIIQKWFSNELDALNAFYKKKLNLHTPILVRYKIFNLELDLNKKNLFLHDKNKNILFKNKKIIIYKIFKNNKNWFKIYLITNIGIFIGSSKNFNFYNYNLTDLFLETTPGRLIFSLNFKNL